MALRNTNSFDVTSGQNTLAGRGATTIVGAFAQMVQCLVNLCAAERDVSGSDSFDPAFDRWFREAEAARAAVLAAADSVIMSLAPTATDRRFVAVARCFEAMLQTHDAIKYANTAQAMLQQAWFYYVPGRGARVARASALLQVFRHHFGILMSLPDYAPVTSLVQNEELALAA